MNDATNRWSLKELTWIAEKLTDYCNSRELEEVEVCEVEDSRWSDPENQRYDVWITYKDETRLGNYRVRQKLMILKGEVIDGETFHKRFHEFYPGKGDIK